MYLRIAVDLAGRGLQDARRALAAEFEDIHRADNTGPHRTDRIRLIMPRGGGAGEIVDAVDRAFDIEGMPDVVFDKAEARMVEQWPDVGHGPRREIVDTDHLLATPQKRVAQMRSDKACSSG